MPVPVLTYQPMVIHGNEYVSNHLHAFADDLHTITGCGFHIVPLQEAITAWLKGRELERAVALCVDDGSGFDFDDLPHPTAGPQRSIFNTLRHFSRERPGAQPRLNATSFVVVSPDARAALDRSCMLGLGWWSDHWWSEAVASGFMHVANHSWDHHHEALPDELSLGRPRGTFRTIDSKAHADHEIRRANEYLRTHAENPGRSLFAYPYGEANPYLTDVYFPRYAQELGIVAAFGDQHGFLDQDQDRWSLPRLHFGRDWSSSGELEALLREAKRPRPVFVEGREAIVDPEDRSRFNAVPRIINEWMAPHGGLAGREILDFGCGQGVSALAIATRHGAKRVVGVDIGLDPEKCRPFARTQLGLRTFPSNLRVHRVEPGFLHHPDDRFDLVYSWSVFEHVDQRLVKQLLESIRSSIKPGGFLFTQIAPLYYSSRGSHLSHKLDTPWVHLLTQHNVLHEQLAAATPDPNELAGLWSTFETLNRVTADELVAQIRDAGFELVRVHKGTEDLRPAAGLKAVFDEKVLRTYEVVVLARRP